MYTKFNLYIKKELIATYYDGTYLWEFIWRNKGRLYIFDVKGEPPEISYYLYPVNQNY